MRIPNVAAPTYISLYAGAGGLDLGFRMAVPGARCICYVEREAPSVALLVDHMQKGDLDDAPVWSDSETFDGRPWRGAVDWVIGGFPCQPASTAGRRAGTSDSRWLWPHIRRILHEARPQGVFLENVRGLLSVNDGRAFEEILRDLASLGYDAEWTTVRASDVGAPHRRERVFIMAHATGQRPGETGQHSERPTERPTVERPTLAHARHSPGRTEHGEQYTLETAGSGQPSEKPDVGDTDQQGPQGRQRPVRQCAYERPAWPPGPTDTGAWAAVLRERPDLAPAVVSSLQLEEFEQLKEMHRDAEPCPDENRRWHFAGSCISGDYWGLVTGLAKTPEPKVRGMANGLARGLGRPDTLRILGNGVVPQQAALAFLQLSS